MGGLGPSLWARVMRGVDEINAEYQRGWILGAPPQRVSRLASVVH